MSTDSTPDPSFDRIANDYHQTKASWNELYLQISSFIEPHIKDKTVLDLGNGGVLLHDVALTKKTIVVDVSQEMLDQIKNPNVVKIRDDARSLSKIEPGSIDVIQIHLCLHHITGRTTTETRLFLQQAIDAAHSKLKSGGQLFVTEAIVNPFLFWIESLVFAFTHFLLKKLGAGMVLFYSKSVLLSALEKRFNKKTIEFKKLNLLKWIDPLGGTLPGIILLPPWAHPARFFLIRAIKT